jgi:outer membrane murein-binding lipoprotein Lpp
VVVCAQVSTCRNEVWRASKQQEEASHAFQDLLVSRAELEGEIEALQHRAKLAKEHAHEAERAAEECRDKER